MNVNIHRILSAAAAALVAVAAAAQLTLVADTIDLGLMAQGARVEGTLKAVNTGSDTVAILGVRTDCGCTTAGYPRHGIAPGDTAVLTIRYHAEGRMWGLFVKRIKVRTSFTQSPYLEGVVTGRVKRPRHSR